MSEAMHGLRSRGETVAPAVAGKREISSTAAPGGITDPVAAFLSDPESHLSDILYLQFRVYKRKLLWRFMQSALARLGLVQSWPLWITDVGAAMGSDVIYLLRRLTRNFHDRLPCERVFLSLIEGDPTFIKAGERALAAALGTTRVEFRYYNDVFVRGLPLEGKSQDLAICSEVVEHLEEPEKLLQEIFRVLKPGGFLLLTTDNSPSVLQRLKRVPAWFNGTYQNLYARPSMGLETVRQIALDGQEYPIYGHINLNPTRYWERLCRRSGFELTMYGTYESIRRGGGSKSPAALAGYFTMGALVYYLLPKRIGRFLGDTTALMLRKPPA